MPLHVDLPTAWAGIIAFAVFMYVVLDGFDLGIGILFPFVPERADRDAMINSIAPFWDSNETWLVLGGVGLWAAFPLAYAILLPAVYIPVTLMLIALIFRGAAFEFRSHARWSQRAWDIAFHLGSVVATFCQGTILGTFISGFEVVGREFAGGTWSWLTPFSIMTGFGLLAGYALLGATWLIARTTPPLQERIQRLGIPVLAAVLMFIALVSLWTPLLHPAIAERWFSLPNLFFFSPVPILTIALGTALYFGIRQRHDAVPFLCAIGLFFLSYSGLAISLWPNVVPPDISFHEASAAPASQAFLLAGTAIVVPFVLIYTAYSYFTFRGKVEEDEGHGGY